MITFLRRKNYHAEGYETSFYHIKILQTINDETIPTLLFRYIVNFRFHVSSLKLMETDMIITI